MRALRWAGSVLLGLAAGVFAYLNAAERVALHLGVATLYRASLPVVVLAAFLLGMVAMFLLGLRHDLKVRRALREYELRARPLPPDRGDGAALRPAASPPHTSRSPM